MFELNAHFFYFWTRSLETFVCGHLGYLLMPFLMACSSKHCLLTRRISMWSQRKTSDKLSLDTPTVLFWEMFFCLFWSDAWESQVSEEADGLWPIHTFATTCLSPFHLSVFKTCSWFHVERFIKLPLFRLRISSVQNIKFGDVLSRWNVQSCAVWQVIHIMPSIL